jgi:putative intracellular protease/amidase
MYVFDGFTDWEAAYAIASINNPAFQKEPGSWRVQTVAVGQGMVRSVGGMAVLPDLPLANLFPTDSAMLILPGGLGWEDGQHLDSAHRAAEFLDAGVPVAAICGATAGLARVGVLDRWRHTSNAASYLKGTGYAGAELYDDEPAVVDDRLITAGGMSTLEFSREIFRKLGVYNDEVLEAWYQLYKTGKSEYFARMAQAAEADTAQAKDSA